MANNSGNTSSAVRQQRKEPHDSLDYFPTPPWATRALCEYLIRKDYWLGDDSVWEPACGSGHMASPLAEYFKSVFASDIMKYEWEAVTGSQSQVCDFLIPGVCDVNNVDWVCTNPPFRLAEEFIHRASQVAKKGFAMLVRSAFLEGKGRYEHLFSINPPSYILQFVERVPMQKGSLNKELSTATSYAWLVWVDGVYPTRFDWIAPCRNYLERAVDYPDPLQVAAGPLLSAMESAQ